MSLPPLPPSFPPVGPTPSPPFSDKTVPRKKGGRGRALSEMSNPEIRERVGAGFDQVDFSIFDEGDSFISYPTVPTNKKIWLLHELHFGDCLSDPPPFFSSWKTWLYGIRQPEWKEKGRVAVSPPRPLIVMGWPSLPPKAHSSSSSSPDRPNLT